MSSFPRTEFAVYHIVQIVWLLKSQRGILRKNRMHLSFAVSEKLVEWQFSVGQMTLFTSSAARTVQSVVSLTMRI